MSDQPSPGATFGEEDARKIWGDDAMFCDFDRAWHHRNYHDTGYPTRVLPDGMDRHGLGDEHPVIPDAYLDHGDLIFVHECPWFGEPPRIRKTQLPQAPDRWQVHQTIDGQLTVTPSIACKACGLHGFFAAGAWRNV